MPTTMRNYLVNHGDLENIGGLAHLAESSVLYRQQPMRNSMPKIVAEKSNLRKLIVRLTDAVESSL